MPLGRVRPLGMRQVIAASCFLLAAAGANAQGFYPRPPGWEWFGTSIPNGTTGITYTSGGATLSGGPSGAGTFVGRNFGQPSSAGVAMNESMRVPINGSAIAVNGARFISVLEAANAASKLALAWQVGYGVGTSIYDYLNDSRLMPTPAGWQFDGGAAPAVGTGAVFVGDAGGGQIPLGSTVGTACVTLANKKQEYWAANVRHSHMVATVVGSNPSPGVESCTLHVQTYDDNYSPPYLQYDSTDPYRLLVGTGPSNVCPASIDALDPSKSVPAGAAPGADGKCRTGRYNGVSDDFAKLRMRDFGSPDALPRLIPDIVAKGGSLAGDPMPSPLDGFPDHLVGPSSSPGPAGSTTTYPPGGGAPVTTTNNTTNNYTYVGGNTINNTITTTTNNGGATTVSTQTPEMKVCGLPGAPPCKIDETGTPTQVEDPSGKIKDALKDPTAVAKDPEGFFPKMPSLNWSFQLPTGCSAVPLPAFAPFVTSIDLCPFVPVFHDLMSVVWLIGGVFGAIKLFMRDALAS